MVFVSEDFGVEQNFHRPIRVEHICHRTRLFTDLLPFRDTRGINNISRTRRSAHTSNEPSAQITDCVVPTYFECFVDIEMVCAIRAPSPVANLRQKHLVPCALHRHRGGPPSCRAGYKCPSARDCNAPIPYSELQSTKELPKIVASAGISDDVKAKQSRAPSSGRFHEGGVKPVNAYISSKVERCRL